MTVQYSRQYEDRTQAMGALTVDKDAIRDMQMATKHSVTVVPGTATVGTIGVRVRPAHCDGWQTLVSGGLPLEIDLAATSEPQSFGFEQPIDAWEITPTAANGTFDVTVAGW